MKKILLIFGFFLIYGVSALVIQPSIPLMIHTTHNNGSDYSGGFNFEFNISDSDNCNSIIWTNMTDLTTDNNGIVFYSLENINFTFDKQYWLCYYRNGVLKENMPFGVYPYSFWAENVTWKGIIDIPAFFSYDNFSQSFNSNFSASFNSNFSAVPFIAKTNETNNFKSNEQIISAINGSKINYNLNISGTGTQTEFLNINNRNGSDTHNIVRATTTTNRGGFGKIVTYWGGTNYAPYVDVEFRADTGVSTSYWDFYGITRIFGSFILNANIDLPARGTATNITSQNNSYDINQYASVWNHTSAISTTTSIYNQPISNSAGLFAQVFRGTYSTNAVTYGGYGLKQYFNHSGDGSTATLFGLVLSKTAPNMTDVPEKDTFKIDGYAIKSNSDINTTNSVGASSVKTDEVRVNKGAFVIASDGKISSNTGTIDANDDEIKTTGKGSFGNSYTAEIGDDGNSRAGYFADGTTSCTFNSGTIGMYCDDGVNQISIADGTYGINSQGTGIINTNSYFAVSGSGGASGTFTPGVDTSIDIEGGIVTAINTAYDISLMQDITYLGENPKTTLTPVTFYWNEQGLKQFSNETKNSGIQRGYVAQDVQIFYPSCVVNKKLKQMENVTKVIGTSPTGIITIGVMQQVTTDIPLITYDRNCLETESTKEMNSLKKQLALLSAKVDSLCLLSPTGCK